MKESVNDFSLPGAGNFARFLEERVGSGRLAVEGPEVCDRSYDCDYERRWMVVVVYDDGHKEELGTYYTYGPKPGGCEFMYKYHGRIPGYVNRLGYETVILAYGTRFCAKTIEEFGRLGLDCHCDNPIQRGDQNSEIPFP